MSYILDNLDRLAPERLREAFEQIIAEMKTDEGQEAAKALRLHFQYLRGLERYALSNDFDTNDPYSPSNYGDAA